MNLLTRWMRFNLVGAAGVAVQLAALALFNHLAPGHYLGATAAALEVTLLHNFVGHVHFTWRDRRHCSSIAGQLLRFHLANGVVSLIGNLALVRVLAGGLHMPLLLADGIAIFCCSILNFCLGHTWAFPAAARAASLASNP